jgi:pimeloyl-ACP methyl ester carboxylesterase
MMIAALVATIVAGCGASSASSPASTSAPTISPAPTVIATPGAVVTPAIVPIRLDEILKLADGRTIKARCLGEGTPTILLEVGGSGDMGEWQPQFVQSLGAGTTTCLYSRAGGRGSSEPKERPVSMDDVTGDAYEVLALAKEKAGVKGPYVFVGWSLGGSVALANALARPDQTVGIAILDTDFPADGLALCKASGRPAADCQAEYEEDIDARFMEMQIAHAVHPLDVPAILVTAMDYPECVESPGATLSADISGVTILADTCAELAGAIADKQVADWSVALPQVIQTRVEADHDGLIWTEGRHIADLILEIVEAARATT